MKTKLIVSLFIFLMIGNVQAKVTPIADWTPSLPGETPNSEKVKTGCAEACRDYGLLTVVCDVDEELVDCPVDGCNYYHRCEKK